MTEWPGVLFQGKSRERLEEFNPFNLYRLGGLPTTVCCPDSPHALVALDSWLLLLGRRR